MFRVQEREGRTGNEVKQLSLCSDFVIMVVDDDVVMTSLWWGSDVVSVVMRNDVMIHFFERGL